jgi:hypothetical protein
MPAKPAAKPAANDAPAPPYFIATAPLFIGGQFGRAHNPGDRVQPDHVAKHGWQHLVRLPDGYEPAPTQQPPSVPDSPDSGQATSSKEGA